MLFFGVFFLKIFRFQIFLYSFPIFRIFLGFKYFNLYPFSIHSQNVLS